ncbi:hypothetical protein M0805_007066 [Coniferiporia weirii]|nr:hypothetical protein M0805_007066 [Coniferiporia weirii]
MFLQLLAASIAEPLITYSLIFGGCCSNALTLEVITSQYPPAGTLVTFAQFLLVALVGLRRQLVLLPRRVPRDNVFKRVAASLHKSGVTNVAVHGQNVHVTRSFAQDLAAHLGGPPDGCENDVQKLSPPGASEDAPPVVYTISFRGPGRSTFDASMPDLATQAELVPSKIKANAAPNVLLPPSVSVPQSISFKIVLQEGPLLSDTANMVLDISEADYPALLYPRDPRFTFNPLRYRLKPRRIPLARYAVQVLLFLLVSLLNNAAFAYHVPMAVHIIFRSGGLVVNMLMGWLFEKRRYSRIQVCSVVLVTLGVALTTLSSTQSKPRVPRKAAYVSASIDAQAVSGSYGKYAIGIGILTLALVLSGFLGLAQDRAFERYGRGDWAEAMFYLHALSLPLFALRWSDLSAQIRTANAGLQLQLGVAAPFVFASTDPGSSPPPLPYLPIRLPSLRVPAFYVPLFANVLTQLLCVAGVNRLTARVGSLTVALVLVVRKAVSLGISVLLLGGASGSAALWFGAAAVLMGTVGYTLGNRKLPVPKKKEE